MLVRRVHCSGSVDADCDALHAAMDGLGTTERVLTEIIVRTLSLPPALSPSLSFGLADTPLSLFCLPVSLSPSVSIDLADTPLSV